MFKKIVMAASVVSALISVTSLAAKPTLYECPGRVWYIGSGSHGKWQPEKTTDNHAELITSHLYKAYGKHLTRRYYNDGYRLYRSYVLDEHAICTYGNPYGADRGGLGVTIRATGYGVALRYKNFCRPQANNGSCFFIRLKRRGHSEKASLQFVPDTV